MLRKKSIYGYVWTRLVYSGNRVEIHNFINDLDANYLTVWSRQQFQGFNIYPTIGQRISVFLNSQKSLWKKNSGIKYHSSIKRAADWLSSLSAESTLYKKIYPYNYIYSFYALLLSLVVGSSNQIWRVYVRMVYNIGWIKFKRMIY